MKNSIKFMLLFCSINVLLIMKQNAWSAGAPASPIDDSRIEVSTMDMAWSIPVVTSTGNDYQLFQNTSATWISMEVICRQEELQKNDNNATTLHNIAFLTGASSAIPFHNISIYLKNTTDDFIDNSNSNSIVDPVTHGYTCVINDKTFEFPVTKIRDWLVFAFDEGKTFNYDGTSNLQVLIIRKSTIHRDQQLFGTQLQYTGRASSTTAGLQQIRHSFGHLMSMPAFGIYPDPENLAAQRGLLNYAPFIAFNKRKLLGEIIKTSTHIPAADNEKPVSFKYIYPGSNGIASGTATSTNTTYRLQYRTTIYNGIYDPKTLGSGVLGDMPRKITGMNIATDRAYINGSQTYETDITKAQKSNPTKIYLRNAQEKAFSTKRPADLINETTTGGGWTLVFDGTFDIYNQKQVKINFLETANFTYDGNENGVEVLFHTSSEASSTNYYYFRYYMPNGATETGKTARTASSNTATFPSSFSSTNNNLAITWEYETGAQSLKEILLSPSAQRTLTPTSYVLFRGEINTERSYFPRHFSSIDFNLYRNVPVDFFKSIKVYNTGSAAEFNFDDAILVAQLDNPTGDKIRVTGDPEAEETALKAGTNYFWFVAELNCERSLDAIFGLQNVESIDIAGAYGTPYSRANFGFPNTEDWGRDTIGFEAITAKERYAPAVCGTRINNVFPVDLSKNTQSVKWERKELNGNWTEISASENVAQDNYLTMLHLTTEDVRKGLNTYRLTAVPTAEASTTCVSTIYKEYEFHISASASNATLEMNGAEISANGAEHFYICADGNATTFAVKHDEFASGYQWEYRDASTENEWEPIPLALVPTANKAEMVLTPQLDWALLRNTEIRAKVISELACDVGNPQVTYSPSFILTVPGENKIAADLPPLVELCRNSGLELAPALELENGAFAYQWYKNDTLLEGQTSAGLRIEALQIYDEGLYHLEIVTLGCTENGTTTLATNSCQVIVSQGPKVVYPRDEMQVRANPGDIAIFEIEADLRLIANKPSDVSYFQWYRHNILTGTDTKLSDDNTYRGTNSSSMIIHPILPKDYTYAGDYYYCEVFGACGNVYGSVKSGALFLVPGDNLSVILEPGNALICEAETATFAFEVWAEGRDSDVRYQWYLDGTALENDAVFQGANTKTLSVNTAVAPAGTDLSGDFTCHAWFFDDDPAMFFIESKPANIILQTLPAANSQPTEIAAKETENIVLEINYQTEAAILNYTWLYEDATGASQTLQTGGGFPSNLVINNITLAEAGRYILRLEGKCNSVELAWNVAVESADGTQSPTSIAEYSEFIGLSVVPNPASDDFVFSFEASGSESHYSATLLDMAGAVIWSTNGAIESKNTIQLNAKKLQLAAGTYFLNVKIGDNIARQIVVIAK